MVRAHTAHPRVDDEQSGPAAASSSLDTGSPNRRRRRRRHRPDLSMQASAFPGSWNSCVIIIQSSSLAAAATATAIATAAADGVCVFRTYIFVGTTHSR